MKAYKRAVPSVALIIPTQDRSACMEHYLSVRWQDLYRLGIDVIVYDSSRDQATEQIVKNCQKAGADNLSYLRYAPQGDMRALDHKVFSACERFCGDYDYLWFSSDGTVFHFDRLANDLFSYLAQGVDMVVLNNLSCPPAPTKEFADSCDLLRECGWFMTMLGSTIVSTKLVRRAVEECPVHPAKDFWLWHPFVYFYLLAGKPCRAVHHGEAVPYEINPYREDSFWKLRGDALWQWGYVWYEAVNSLPASYDRVKSGVLRSYDAHVHLFSPKSLLSMQEYGALSPKKVRKYRKYLPAVTDTNIAWFYLISLFGNRTAIQCLKKIYHKIKGTGGFVS